MTVAQVAAAEQPGLAERFTLPSGNATNEAFPTFARKMLEQGQAERESPARHGLADDVLDRAGTFWSARSSASNETLNQVPPLTGRINGY